MAFKSILSAGSRLIYLSSMLLGRHVACCMFLSFFLQSKQGLLTQSLMDSTISQMYKQDYVACAFLHVRVTMEHILLCILAKTVTTVTTKTRTLLGYCWCTISKVWDKFIVVNMGEAKVTGCC